MAHTAFTFRSGGHLVSSGSEIFWSNWGVSVGGGILCVALPLLLHWIAGSCHLSLLKFYLSQPFDHNFGFTV